MGFIGEKESQRTIEAEPFPEHAPAEPAAPTPQKTPEPVPAEPVPA